MANRQYYYLIKGVQRMEETVNMRTIPLWLCSTFKPVMGSGGAN